MTKKLMTAAELMAELANDAAYQKKLDEKERDRAKTELQLREEEAELLSELRETGMQVRLDCIPGQKYVGPPRSISDLVNTESRYPQAIPVLVRHLSKNYSRPIMQSIIRALTTPDSKGVAFGQIADLFRSTDDSESEMKWLLGAALVEASTSENVDKVIELANDPCHGRGREYLPLGLVNASKQKALPILESWQNDAILAENAKKAIPLLR
ncbi:hypothetical protein [Roseimaritima sediminicola]|uniref:hypothetical protein n=1 Tax=Roseimaritima sediminicola TaxID=2662066 RepID=UPI0012984D5D|nr:hypothetical protein [Roseimaritima sediminicola]